MGTPLAPERVDIYEEDTAYRRAVSSSIFRKFGRAINFIMNRIIYESRFDCPGNFRGGTSVSNGQMGTIVLTVETKIRGYTMFVSASGSGAGLGTGVNEVNFSVIDEDGVILGDLFTTTPKVSGASVSRVSVARRYNRDGTILSTHESHPSDSTVGTINPTFLTLPANYQLRSNLLGNKNGAQDLSFSLYLENQE